MGGGCNEAATARSARVGQSLEQSVVAREHSPQSLRECCDSSRLLGLQMPKESCGSSYGLACIVDYVVQPRQAFEQESSEQLDAWCMSQIKAMDLQPVAKLRKIALL